MLSNERLAEMQEIARRDDWHIKLVGSDIRLLIGDLRRAYDRIEQQELTIADTIVDVNMTAARAERLEADLAAAREALQALLDVQNGPPLIRDTEEWNVAMALARAALAAGKGE